MKWFNINMSRTQEVIVGILIFAMGIYIYLGRGLFFTGLSFLTSMIGMEFIFNAQEGIFVRRKKINEQEVIKWE